MVTTMIMLTVALLIAASDGNDWQKHGQMGGIMMKRPIIVGKHLQLGKRKKFNGCLIALQVVRPFCFSLIRRSIFLSATDDHKQRFKRDERGFLILPTTTKRRLF